mmetsp:Transcript_3239/g.8787  ORF Transcript_3239/g.8787 Transcript_3239/m.8787 type:complete len:206 (-) Transcript_3239:441-1058(-)
MARTGSALPLLLLVVGAWVALPKLFVSPQAEVSTARRSLLLSGVLGAVASQPALAAEFPGLGKQKGPFEITKEDIVIVGDKNAKDAKDAIQKVVSLQAEAEGALEALKKNPQADVSSIIHPFSISELRVATNTINNLMDDQSAAGTQRLQRLMMQAKYQFNDDVPFPLSKKGEVQARGEQRLARIEEALKAYIANSRQLMEFVNA